MINRSINFILIKCIFVYRANSANEKLINSDSTEDIEQTQTTQTSSSPRIRNRYLKRVGVGENEIEDDSPLLDDAE